MSALSLLAAVVFSCAVVLVWWVVDRFGGPSDRWPES